MAEEFQSLGSNKTNRNNNLFTESPSIRLFYKNAVIFVTGGTGFLGKVLIEKLLRTCTDIRAVYVHVRSKRGINSEQRYKEFVKHEIFDRLRAEHPSVLAKLACVAGDITQPKLGLNDEDYAMILSTVNLVFHSAATVKFNEPLKEAGNLNAFGTERLMEMCTKMTGLKSVVHISTAYCNPGRKYIGEIVYPSSSPLDRDCFMKCVHTLPEEVLNSALDLIKGPHPNTYTLTKSIAELIVAEYSHKFPVSIVRPSIITGSVNEPYPGWVDNAQGITGIITEIGRGTISTILADSQLICDIIPVDVVVNTIIGAAWNTSLYNDQRIQVFNCTSGQINPVLWERLGFYTLKWSRVYPSKYVMFYPNFSYRKNALMHKIYEILFHYFPAFILDTILKFQGSKPIMVKNARKIHLSGETGKFFSCNEWVFDNENQRRLVDEMKAAVDGKEFPCNITDLSYDDYVRNFILGIRKYLLRDGDESLNKARRRLSTLFWLKKTLQLIFGSLLVYSLTRILFN